MDSKHECVVSAMRCKQKRAMKARLIRTFGSRCWWCPLSRELPAEELTIDHLIPRSKGGSNSLENLRLACRSCNSSRRDSLYPPPQFRSCVHIEKVVVDQGGPGKDGA